jgi:hypothetical protein
VQTAFARNLPFFYTKQMDVPSHVRVPTLQTRDILATTATGTVGGSIMDYAYNVEYSQTWSGGVQFQIRPPTMAELSYMGTWTLGADNATVRNVPEPGPGPIQSRRPIPELSRINAIRFDGKSIYHGMTMKVERRLASNFAYNVSYTLSRSRDDASSPGPTESEANVPQNVRNVFDETGEWALSSFDHRHQFIASGVYELPSLRGAGRVVNGVLGGWRANAIFIAQSGAPFTVNLSVDRANIGAGPAQRPDQLRNPNLPGGERTPERWFDTSAFALQAPFTFGSAPRNSVTGPGYANVDFAFAKNWKLGGTSQLEFRWEVFNLFDRANFDLPNRLSGNPSFGRIFSAKNPREMQFGLRFTFCGLGLVAYASGLTSPSSCAPERHLPLLPPGADGFVQTHRTKSTPAWGNSVSHGSQDAAGRASPRYFVVSAQGVMTFPRRDRNSKSTTISKGALQCRRPASRTS